MPGPESVPCSKPGLNSYSRTPQCGHTVGELRMVEVSSGCFNLRCTACCQFYSAICSSHSYPGLAFRFMQPLEHGSSHTSIFISYVTCGLFVCFPAPRSCWSLWFSLQAETYQIKTWKWKVKHKQEPHGSRMAAEPRCQEQAPVKNSIPSGGLIKTLWCFTSEHGQI